MNEIVEHWYEISLQELVKKINDNNLKYKVAHIIPYTNFNFEYRYYSSNSTIIPVITCVDSNDIFTQKISKSHELNLDLCLQLGGINSHKNAKLRFKTNILEQIENYSDSKLSSNETHFYKLN